MGSIKIKTLALIALVGLSVVGTAVAVQQLIAPSDHIAVREEVIYGDKVATEGLTLDWSMKAMNHLSWDSHITLGQEEPAVTTNHRFHPDTHWDRWNWVPDGISVYDHLSSHHYFRYASEAREEGDWDYLPESLLSFLQRQVNANRDEWENQGMLTVPDVKAKDYFAYYPLQVGTDLPILLYSETEGGNSRRVENQKAIQKFFRIPMLENQYLTIDLNGYGESNIDSIEISNRWGQESDAFYFNMESVYTDENCYLWFSNRTDQNKRVDTSMIPGGYGIYVLPYGPVEGETGSTPQRKNGNMDIRNAKYDIYPDRLRLFYSVPEEDFIYHVSLSLAGDRLLLYAEEAGRLVCKVIDVETAETLQVLDLGPVAETDRYVAIIDNNDKVRTAWYQEEKKDKDFSAIAAATPMERLYDQDYSWLASVEDGRLSRTGLVARRADGTYEVAILLDATVVERQDSFGPMDSFPYTIYYDGNRLALAGTFDHLYYEGDNLSRVYTPNAVYVVVYMPEGLQYYGVLQNSLMDANAITGQDWPDSVHWNHPNALKLRAGSAE